VFLVCTSTYGQGDVPDNAKNLYEALRASKPDLSRVRYGVFGLGDRTYAETFNFGGRKFDELLASLGARRIGERVQHDASSGVLPEETAQEWGGEWLKLAQENWGQSPISDQKSVPN
jgi:MioC protein